MKMIDGLILFCFNFMNYLTLSVIITGTFTGIECSGVDNYVNTKYRYNTGIL